MLKKTSLLLREAGFTGPGLLVDEAQARRNIATMAAKARAAGVRFRPHFKTHQSPEVGRWFADEGVTAITVSSLEMARHFADHGWRDITLALLVNPLQWPAIKRLALSLDARGGRLGILLDSPAVARQLRKEFPCPLDIWLKVDTGYGRTGVAWDDRDTLRRLLAALEPAGDIRGLLTHSGHAYGAATAAGRRRIWHRTLERMTAAREVLVQGEDRDRKPVRDLESCRDLKICQNLEISVGDTPCCATMERLDGPDEVRPGNFVFFDLMQWRQGVCRARELACGLVCPIIGIYPRSHRLVIHGGAVHLSRESLATGSGDPVFGYAGRLDGNRQVLEDAPVTSLSQEHGVLQIAPRLFPALTADLDVGDLLLIWPVHSCLSCNLMADYRSLAGAPIAKFP